MPEVLYESIPVPRARRVALSLCFGAGLPLAGAWWRWVRDGRGGAALPEIALGIALAVALTLAALRSRTVYRVELTDSELLVHRDPGVVDRYALGGLSAASEPTPGGWSRDPSETLVITARGANPVRYRLPDDADTAGVVADIAAAQAEPRGGGEGVL